MTFNEFQSMILFRRIIEVTDNSITLENGIQLINAKFSDVILNTQVSLAEVRGSDNSIILTSNQEPICIIDNIEDVEIIMPPDPSLVKPMALRAAPIKSTEEVIKIDKESVGYFI